MTDIIDLLGEIITADNLDLSSEHVLEDAIQIIKNLRRDLSGCVDTLGAN